MRNYYQIHSRSYFEHHRVYWLPGERDVIIFYALQQQQEKILIERNFLAGKQINLNNFFTFAPLLIHLGAL